MTVAEGRLARANDLSGWFLNESLQNSYWNTIFDFSPSRGPRSWFGQSTTIDKAGGITLCTDAAASPRSSRMVSALEGMVDGNVLVPPDGVVKLKDKTIPVIEQVHQSTVVYKSELSI